jgi:hypothetical protein
MKSRILYLMAAIIFFIATNVSAQEKKDWKEMHNFHAVMSKTFHPAEEGKLQPLKDSATLLLAKAKAWQQSTVPQGYNAKVTAPILKQLVTKCTELQKAVAAKKDDKTLTKLITEAHEIFHEIMEKCQKEENHH